MEGGHETFTNEDGKDIYAERITLQHNASLWKIKGFTGQHMQITICSFFSVKALSVN